MSVPARAGRLARQNVLGFVAIFIALGSGAYALGRVPNRNGRISACYVASGKHRGDVRLLVAGRCRPGEKRVSWNQKGVPGARGADGAPGGDGAAGATSVVVRVGPETTIAAGGIGTADVSCKPGERALGGGPSARIGTFSGEHPELIRTISSVPMAGNKVADEGEVPDGWNTFVFNGSTTLTVEVARVVCASP